MAQVVEAPDGNSLAVEISGAPDGHAVFLLHGTPGTLRGPRPRGIFLYRLGIKLISYNRPGYPGSDRKEGRSVADAADDVKAIADSFGIDKFSVIGRSGGAPHALACAASAGLRDRVICVAALSTLAPYDAEGLDWFVGMAESNVEAFQNAESDLAALIAKLKQHAGQVRNNSQGLINALWPELAGADKQAIGGVGLRRIIAQTHTEAVRESVDGWIDDVIALSSPWKFELSEISVPVLLWHGGEDIFSPINHTRWLYNRISTSELVVRSDTAHFAAVEILPEVLTWALSKANADPGLLETAAGR